MLNKKSLEVSMHTILITGANRGLGLEFCKQYLKKQYQVYACCRQIDTANDLITLQSNYPELLSIIPLDVTSQNSIDELKNHINNRPIDILINNAGIYTENEHDYHHDANTWQKFFMVNSIAPYFIILSLLENCQKSTQKKIININSGLGSITEISDGTNIPYRASKAAQNAITKSLAAENISHKMIIVAMSPGWVRTDMGGASAPLSPEESVSAMINRIEKLTPNDNGKFYSYNGKEIPW